MKNAFKTKYIHLQFHEDDLQSLSNLSSIEYKKQKWYIIFSLY